METGKREDNEHSLLLRSVVDVGVTPRLAQALVRQDLGDRLLVWSGRSYRMCCQQRAAAGREAARNRQTSRQRAEEGRKVVLVQSSLRGLVGVHEPVFSPVEGKSEGT